MADSDFRNTVFSLWERCQKSDIAAREELRRLYIDKFPNNTWLARQNDRKSLHTMCLHLTG